MKHSISILLIILLSFSMYNFDTSHERIDDDDKIIRLLDSIVTETGIPGINVSIINKSGIQKNYSFGYADIAKKQSLDTKHVMFSGSIGKTYAVAVLMHLVDEGKLVLNKKFSDYFPDVKWLLRLPNINEITIEMLLMHTSGLPRYIENQDLWISLIDEPDKVWTYKDRLSYVFDSKAVHAAGKGWAYSDTNYLLLGMLIEKITEDDYYDVLTDLVLKPHKLKYTYPSLRRDIKNLAVGYSKLDSFFRMPEIMVKDGKYAFNPQMEWTGGGIASTTSDLAKWAKIFYEGNLFSDTLLNKIISPNKNADKLSPKVSYGMGSFIYHTKFGDVYGHSGFMPGFNSLFSYCPKNETAIAIQTNCDFAGSKFSMVLLLEKIMNRIEGEHSDKN